MRSGVDQAGMDTAARAADDFFGYVNGGWVRDTEIPADRAAHGAFRILADQAERDVHAIVEEAAGDTGAPAGTNRQLVGAAYRSFMDQDRIQELGLSPVRSRLTEALAVTGAGDLFRLLGRLQAEGVCGVVQPYVNTDARNSSRYLVYLEQGGLGLPDESYYREDQYAAIRAAYREHVGDLLRMAGIGGAAEAERVFGLETRLAAAHWDVVRCRDAVATYTLMTRDELAAAAPEVDWHAWSEGFGAPEDAFAEIVVRQPSFLAGLSDLLGAVPIGDWGLWLAWQVLRDAAPYLHAEAERAAFEFYRRTLYGVPEQRERWKRGVELVEEGLGEAVGELYVERHYPPAAAERMGRLVDNLIAAYRHNISELTWMSADTKVKALDKLGKFTPKIGHPTRFRDYSSLRLQPDDLMGNVRELNRFETRRNLAKLGGPIDRDEWYITPQTINAYYNPGLNEIVFPAAILQPPFFDLEADDAVNYGAIGAVIGHEIGHGFDDQGSKYDGAGNLEDWWTDEDRSRFDLLTRALAAQYAQFTPRQFAQSGESARVNGELTVGENIGDLGGLAIAYDAWRISGGQDEPLIDGFTGSQRVFLGWAQVWRTKVRDEALLRLLSVDPHSPAEFRTNVVRNLEEFYAAFGVAEGDGMWLPPEARVRIW